MSSDKKRAFVTGATGFVGSHLVEALLGRGYEVSCLVRSDPKWLKDIPVDRVQGDLGSITTLTRAVADATHIFHVAGLTRAKTESELYEANVVGTLNLLKTIGNAAPQVERVVVTSSLAAVGFSERLIATESSPLRPISAYGRSKARMENAISALMKDQSWGHIPVTIVRPPAVYGPREKDIFTFVKMLSLGLAPIVGSGTSLELNLVYVKDLVQGMIDAGESEKTVGETYFIGSEEQYSWQDVKGATLLALERKFALTVPVPRQMVSVIGSIVELGGRVLGKYPPLNEEKAIEILKACKMCSVAKAMETFEYRQRTSLADGLKETVRWYRANNWL